MLKNMETKHYLVKNLEKFSKSPKIIKNLKVYLGHIENIFTVIEEVFGQKWQDDHINIILNDSKSGASYSRPNNIHTVNMGIWNKAIQSKEYPESLWGCLLHETLHAFMNPIIHGKIDGLNYLDGNCNNEPFTRTFQALVYLKLREIDIISKNLCDQFLDKLEKELKDGSQKLYNRYFAMFLKNPFDFSKFIKRLQASNMPLFRRETFTQDLKKAEEFLVN